MRYATADGTATAGLDYTATNGMLTWGSGIAATRTVNVPILDDALVEGDESLLLTLSDPTGGATVGPPSGAQVIIADNEVPRPDRCNSSRRAIRSRREWQLSRSA